LVYGYFFKSSVYIILPLKYLNFTQGTPKCPRNPNRERERERERERVKTARAVLGVSVVTSALLFSGCGSSSGGNSGATISGLAIDGYIRGATACIDRNYNQSCDSDEPNATTQSGGQFTIPASATDSGNYPIVIYADTNAYDEGTSSYFTTPLKLTAPSGVTTITPITTLIQQKLKDNNDGNLTKAESEVATLLGVASDKLYIDYVASGDSATLAKAQQVATKIQNNNGDLSTVITDINTNGLTNQSNNNNNNESDENNNNTPPSPPTATSQSSTINEDNTLVFTQEAFSSGFSGGNLTKIKITALPTNGTLKLNGTDVTLTQEITTANLADLTYTPNSNYNGNDSFKGQGFDGTSWSSEASMNIAVSSVNDTPTITSNASFSINEGTTSVATLTSSDGDNDTLTYSIVDGLDGAKFSLHSSSGILSLVSALDYENPTDVDTNNQYKVQVKVADGNGGESTQTITVSIVNTNDTAPVLNDSTISLSENATVGSNIATIVASDSDGDISNLTYTITSGNSDNKFTLNSTTGVLQLNGAVDYEGTQTYALGIEVSDGVNTDTATLTINITNTNDTAPNISGTPDTSIAENSSYTFTPTSSDSDGDSLTFSITNKPSWASFNTSTGELSGTPSYSDSGTYSNITISASDATHTTNLTSFTITVTNVNRAPTATTESFSTNEDTAYSGTLTGTDADGDTITYSKVSDPTHGTLTINSNGTFTYTPSSNYNGSDSFTYKASDGVADSSNKTVTVTVNSVNDTGGVTSQSASVNEDATKTFTSAEFSAGFSDIDGDSLTKIKITALPTNGTLKLNGTDVTLNQEITTANLADLTYTPNSNYNGNDSFSGQGFDGTTYSDTASMNITVNSINDVPAASNFTYSTDIGNSAKTFNWKTLSSASDIDNDTLTATVKTQGSKGNSVISGDSITYTPNTNQSGSDSVVITISDGNGGTIDSTITVNSIDTIAPTISTLSPADDGTNIGVNSDLVVTFSENIAKVAGKNITIKKSSDSSTVETIDATKAVVSNTQATINPTTTLSGETSYYIEIESGAFTDSAGNAFAGIANTTTWNFTTAETTAPTTTSVAVPANATYLLNQNLDFTVNFSESVNITGAPRIALMIGGSTKYATYQSGSGTSAVTFRYAVESGLSDTDGITVGALELNSGGIKDGANNNATLTLNSVGNTENVKVETTPPTITATYPITNATSVGPYTWIEFTFSKAMDATTLTTANITLNNSKSCSSVEYNTTSYIAKCLVYDLTNTNTKLSDSTAYTATISTSVKDTAGNAIANAYNLSFTTGAENKLSRLRTGQTTSYANYDDGWYVTNGNLGIERSFTRNTDTVGEEYVIDNATGLMWQDDAVNLNAANGWSGANTACDNSLLGGYDDWRLPTFEEFNSIVKSGASWWAIFSELQNPAHYAPNSSKTGRYYWTNTSYIGASNHKWLNAIHWGTFATEVDNQVFSNTFYRCVRGAENIKSIFIRDTNKEVVLDISNGLMWQDDSAAKTATSTWDGAMPVCENLTLGGYTDWRLPNKNELANLADRDKYDPAISPTFVNVVSNNYLTSNLDNEYAYYPQVINFHTGGYDGGVERDSTNYVRCVRGGQ